MWDHMVDGIGYTHKNGFSQWSAADHLHRWFGFGQLESGSLGWNISFLSNGFSEPTDRPNQTRYRQQNQSCPLGILLARQAAANIQEKYEKKNVVWRKQEDFFFWYYIINAITS
jgi:hypothetical protein